MEHIFFCSYFWISEWFGKRSGRSMRFKTLGIQSQNNFSVLNVKLIMDTFTKDPRALQGGRKLKENIIEFECLMSLISNSFLIVLEDFGLVYSLVMLFLAPPTY